MFKILCTGNPNKNTIAKTVKEMFPDADCIHLSAGYDFTKTEGLDKFRQKIKNYNVFINASHIGIDVQLNLLKITRDVWNTGHVFNIGSVMEYDFFHWVSPEGAENKKKLKTLSLDLCNETFKTTHMIVGSFKDQKDDAEFKMDPVHIVNAIKWIMEAESFHVPIIGIENDYCNGDKWLKGKSRGIKEAGR
jgi:hypothetical protein